MLIRFVDDMRKDYVGQYAAQAAFFTMLSAVPFLMLVILCLKYFVNVDVNAVTNTIEAAFPLQVSIYISQIITEVFYRSESMALLSITVITALWSSSRGTMSIYCGINQIYGYVRMYNWFAARLASLFYNIVFLAVLIGSIIVLVFGNSLMSFISPENVVIYYPLRLILTLKFPIFFVLFVLAFTAIYTLLPQRKIRFRSQIIGAVTTAVGWMVFSYLFSVYIEQFSRFSVLYGSLTAIVLLMLWMYFCMYMLLIGAEINKHIENGFFRRVGKNVFSKKRGKNTQFTQKN
ncbi:MAG: YihY/virulence factor BrkB family protein [Oscillospiraceae bacterium]|nr:YihY/virulence factor BrkB family protein [Oscillospiraceae bacterium]